MLKHNVNLSLNQQRVIFTVEVLTQTETPSLQKDPI